MELTSYIKNIALILIFSSFAAILSPGEKYRNYINLVLGIIIIILVLNPVIKVASGGYYGYEGLLRRIEANVGISVTAKEKGNYEEESLNLILDTYKGALTEQIKSFLLGQGYELTACFIDVSSEDSAFGAIKTMSMEMRPLKEKKGLPAPIINVEKVEIGPKLRTASELVPDFSQVDSGEIKNLKKYFSGFYNLSVDNIHITVAQ